MSLWFTAGAVDKLEDATFMRYYDRRNEKVNLVGPKERCAPFGTYDEIDEEEKNEKNAFDDPAPEGTESIGMWARTPFGAGHILDYRPQDKMYKVLLGLPPRLDGNSMRSARAQVNLRLAEAKQKKTELETYLASTEIDPAAMTKFQQELVNHQV